MLTEILGDKQSGVRGVRCERPVQSGQQQEEIICDGVFIAIGHRPNTALFRGQLELDPEGYIVSRNFTETSVPGVFAAGDVQGPGLSPGGDRRRVRSCMAAMQAERYLESLSVREELIFLISDKMKRFLEATGRAFVASADADGQPHLAVGQELKGARRRSCGLRGLVPPQNPGERRRQSQGGHRRDGPFLRNGVPALGGGGKDLPRRNSQRLCPRGGGARDAPRSSPACWFESSGSWSFPREPIPTGPSVSSKRAAWTPSVSPSFH